MGEGALKVIGVGDNVVDTYVNEHIMFPGGNALNFSVFSAMLGCDSAYLGVFGTDEAASHVQKTLLAVGVDISRCRCADGENGQALLTIEKGERIFISSNQGGIAKSVPMDFIFEDIGYLQSFSIVHTSAYSYMDACLPKLQSLSPLVSYDFSDDFDHEHVLALCPYIDIGFFSCSGWPEATSRELLEEAVEHGCSMAVATRGSQQVILFDGSSWFEQAPLPITPTDTLGAGDAFISQFLVSYVGGKTKASFSQAPLIENALREAISFAAEICQVQGSFGHGLRY